MTCPKCKSKSVDEHPINLTPYHWYLCMDCSYVWNETGYSEWRREYRYDKDDTSSNPGTEVSPCH